MEGPWDPECLWAVIRRGEGEARDEGGGWWWVGGCVGGWVAGLGWRRDVVYSVAESVRACLNLGAPPAVSLALCECVRVSECVSVCVRVCVRVCV